MSSVWGNHAHGGCIRSVAHLWGYEYRPRGRENGEKYNIGLCIESGSTQSKRKGFSSPWRTWGYTSSVQYLGVVWVLPAQYPHGTGRCWGHGIMSTASLSLRSSLTSLPLNLKLLSFLMLPLCYKPWALSQQLKTLLFLYWDVEHHTLMVQPGVSEHWACATRTAWRCVGKDTNLD